MKIGILTFHRAHNYGALLQCYALKEYISNLGHQVSIIDYWPDYHSSTYKLLPDFANKTFKGKIKALVLFILGFFRIRRRAEGYRKFMKEYLELDKNIQHKTAHDLNNLEFDAVVYGSDQIWRKSTLPSFKNFDLVYWGQQPVNAKKKIAYAPSMGEMSYKIEELDLLKKTLNNFNAISVRETATKELLKEKMNIEAELVLDPVFLLDKNKWEELCDSKPAPIKAKEKYIFFYQLMRNDEACRLVEKAAKHFGFRVIEIRGRVDALKFGNRYMQTVDPIGFIQLIRNAQFVVSTSFHGTAFSVIFEKQFFATGMGKNAERAKSLLKNLGVENRYIEEAKETDFSDHINYKQVKKEMNKLKSISKYYINNNL